MAERQDFDIRIRLTGMSAEDVTELTEAVEEFVEDKVPANWLDVVGGPVEAGNWEWESTARDNLHEMMD